MLTSPPFSGMIHAHQPGPTKWFVAVARIPKQDWDQSGNFFASSSPSQSFTPVQRAHTAVVGCSVLARNQPSCRASTAATPEASRTHRAETVKVPGRGCFGFWVSAVAEALADKSGFGFDSPTLTSTV